MEEDGGLVIKNGYDVACVYQCKYTIGPCATAGQPCVKWRGVVLHGGSLASGGAPATYPILIT